MSLNGLDAEAFVDAHHGALAEGGGWFFPLPACLCRFLADHSSPRFLLKYAARDEVQLFKKGNGGLSEVKETVDEGDEQSPLYGFINYRRRKVILKYTPEGTSRVLQGVLIKVFLMNPVDTSINLARVAVHFQSVLEKLAPYDAIFSFVNPSELKDTKLSSACSLHTMSASVKSSSDSLRQSGLAEIVEDAHENQSGAISDKSVKRGRGQSISSVGSRVRSAPSKDRVDHHTIKHTPSPSQSSTRTVRDTNKALPPTPHHSNHSLKEPNIDVDVQSTPQSRWPSIRDLPKPYEYKPKVKLGPRPSLDWNSQSPISDPSSRPNVFRPVSTLPPSIRMPSRQPVSSRPKSQNSVKNGVKVTPPKFTLSPPLPILSTQLSTPHSHARTNGIGTPVRAIESKSPGMTPEKRRLMKALQLRQKQMAMRSLTPNHDNDHGSIRPTFDVNDISLKESISFCTSKEEIHDVHVVIKDTDEDPEMIGVVIEAVSEPDPPMIDSSPISVLDTSDGPSTQASSITDDEEHAVSKAHELMETSQPSLLEDPGLLGMILSDEPVSAEIVGGHEGFWRQENQIPTPKSLDIHMETVQPHEIPLPPVDADEEFSLGPQTQVFAGEWSLKPLQHLNAGSVLPPIAAQHLHSYKGVDVPRPPSGGIVGDNGGDLVSPKRGFTRSLRRVSSAENSDDQFLSDDSFMEELGSATVQEAKPISVSLSKTSIMPLFPKPPVEHSLNEPITSSRSFSNPSKSENREEASLLPPRLLVPVSSRSFSAAANPPSQPSWQASAIALKKVGVSSGISQRIKALEQLSSRPTSPSSPLHPAVGSPGSSPTVNSIRKSSQCIQPATNNLTQEKKSGIRNLKVFTAKNLSGVPASDRKESPANEKSVDKSRRSRPSSISATKPNAQDLQQIVPVVQTNSLEQNKVDLNENSSVVGSANNTSTTSLSRHLGPKIKSTRSMSSSSTDLRNEPSEASRRNSFASRKSTSNGKTSDVDLPRSASDKSLNAAIGAEGPKEDRKESRKSRLFKRMSNISSSSRRSIVQALSSSSKEEPIVEHQETPCGNFPTTRDMGDVNIQFPDTLVLMSIVIRNHCANMSLALETKRYEN